MDTTELPGRRRRAQRAGVTEGGGREGVRRSPQEKKEVWEELCVLQEELKEVQESLIRWLLLKPGPRHVVDGARKEGRKDLMMH